MPFRVYSYLGVYGVYGTEEIISIIVSLKRFILHESSNCKLKSGPPLLES